MNYFPYVLAATWVAPTISGVVCLLVGAVAGFLIARVVFNKMMEKNPPVNRNMIKAMYMQMGRKPSEKDINRVMETMMPTKGSSSKKKENKEKKVKDSSKNPKPNKK